MDIAELINNPLTYGMAAFAGTMFANKIALARHDVRISNVEQSSGDAHRRIDRHVEGHS